MYIYIYIHVLYIYSIISPWYLALYIPLHPRNISRVSLLNHHILAITCHRTTICQPKHVSRNSTRFQHEIAYNMGSPFDSSIGTQNELVYGECPVDGRNPTSPWMVETLKIKCMISSIHSIMIYLYLDGVINQQP